MKLKIFEATDLYYLPNESEGTFAGIFISTKNSYFTF